MSQPLMEIGRGRAAPESGFQRFATPGDRPLRRTLWLLVLIAWTSGCATPEPEVHREDVVCALSDRVGDGRGPNVGNAFIGELWEDGLDVREAGALALANNPEFLAALTALDVEHARFIQAGLLQNPLLPVLFPLDSKQFEATLMVFVDALWERPRRLELATKELEAVAEQLVSQGLATFRDGQIALLELARLREHRHWANEALRIHGERASLQQQRLRDGDATTLDTARSENELNAARVAAARLDARVGEALVTLRSALGVNALPEDFETLVSLPAEPSAMLPELQAAKDTALASRPDVVAADLRLERAEAACRLAEVDIASVAVIADVNALKDGGFEAGPGLQIELPVFDHGQGRRALAAAELGRAVARRRAISWQVESEVERAWALARSASSIARAARAAAESARRLERRTLLGRTGGSHTDVDVLDASLTIASQQRQVTEARFDAWAALIRAEFAIGRRLDLLGER